jgi:hypothetical protein
MTPTTPQNVYVQTANGQVLISWDRVVGVSSYDVQRATDQISYSNVASLSPAQTEFLDDTVVSGTQYYYKVAGVNASGTGAYSTPQSVVPVKPGEMSLGQLRLLAKQKADRVNSNFVTLPEWNTYINQSYFELYDLLVQKYGNDYYVQSFTFTTDGSQSYALPDGVNNDAALAFYKLLGIDAAVGTGWLTLKKYEFIERNSYVYPQITTNLLGIAGMRYRLVGTSLQFIPTPAGGQTIQVWYVPRLTAMLRDTDTCDGVSGWTEYIAVDAAIKALQKEESDVSILMVQKQALIARIEAAAENRDAGEPERISDFRGTAQNWGYDDSPNGGM